MQRPVLSLVYFFLQQSLIVPVAMQVKRKQAGLVWWGPLPPLRVIQSPCDWRWQGDGDTKPMTESCGEKEGVSSGHWLWQCLPAHVFFTWWQVQRSAWRWSSPWLTNRLLKTCSQLEDHLVPMSRGGEETTLAESKLPFVTVRGGTLVTVWPLISNSSLATVNNPPHSRETLS